MKKRTILKLIVVRTIFDSSAPRITDIYQTVRDILNLNLEKIVLHPEDLHRVMHALQYFIAEIDPGYSKRVNEMVISRL